MRERITPGTRVGDDRVARRAPWRSVATLVVVAVALLTAGAVVPAAPAQAAAAAHEAIGIIVTGDLVQAPGTMQTYSGNAYWLTQDELAAIKAAKGVAGSAHADLWMESEYSFCEDHGTAIHGWATAAGLGLKQLLEDAGLTSAEVDAQSAVKVSSAVDGYSATLDLTQTRYLFEDLSDPDNAAKRREVEPMLALYENAVDEAAGYGALPVEATDALDGEYTRLMFGQLTTAESNQCNYVQDAGLVALAESSPAFTVDAPDAYSSDSGGRQKTKYTLAELVAEGNEQREYTVAAQAYTCDGLDLRTILGEARGAISPQDRVLVDTDAGTEDLGVPVGNVTPGAYLLAYYSQDASGAAIDNDTQVMLYGDGVALADVVSITIEHVEATAGLSLTSPTVSQRKASIARGMRLALRATAIPADGASKGDSVTWTSSATKVAKVSANGTVTGRRAGTAVITATSGSHRAKFSVKVVARAKKARKVRLPKSKALAVGASTRLSARLSPASATVTIAWRSSNRKVATVDRSGRITALKKGRATITVRTSNGKTARCVLKVK